MLAIVVVVANDEDAMKEFGCLLLFDMILLPVVET
jgi:hypothetical protein